MKRLMLPQRPPLVNKLLVPNFLLRTSLLTLINTVVLMVSLLGLLHIKQITCNYSSFFGSNVIKKSLNRRDFSIMNIVQLGHTRLTDAHLFFLVNRHQFALYVKLHSPFNTCVGLFTIY